MDGITKGLLAASAAVLLSGFLGGCMTENSVRRAIVDELGRADLVTEAQQAERLQQIDVEHPPGYGLAEILAAAAGVLVPGGAVATVFAKRMAVSQIERQPSRSGLENGNGRKLNELAPMAAALREMAEEHERGKLVKDLADAIVITPESPRPSPPGTPPAST